MPNLKNRLQDRLPPWAGRLLCRLGYHRWQFRGYSWEGNRCFRCRRCGRWAGS